MAQPTSVFQNQSVVAPVAAMDHSATWGRYHSTSPAGVGLSPGNPDTPYAPSETMTTGLGHWEYS